MARSPRMDQLEAMLAAEPGDAFLRYALAMEHASAGDEATCADQLLALIESTKSDPYVPAFLMAGQVLYRLGRDDQACAVLRLGIEAAHRAGNDHARGEMEGLLSSIE